MLKAASKVEGLPAHILNTFKQESSSSMATCLSQKTPAQQKQRGEKNSKGAYKATQLCKFHLMGSCKRQGGCTFAHSIEDLKAPPIFWKTRLCESYMQTGTCKNGHTCRFAHGKEEMRLASVLRKQLVQADCSLAPHMSQAYRTPPIPQVACVSSLADSSGMLASMTNQPAGQSMLPSWAAVPPPPGLEQLQSPLVLDTSFCAHNTKIDALSDVFPCKPPMKIMLGTESPDSMSTASDPSAEGWSSFSSQHTLPEMA